MRGQRRVRRRAEALPRLRNVGVDGRHERLERGKVQLGAQEAAHDEAQLLAVKVGGKVVQQVRLDRLLLVFEKGVPAKARRAAGGVSAAAGARKKRWSS